MNNVKQTIDKMLETYGDMMVQFTNGYKKDFFFRNNDDTVSVSISTQMPIQLYANMSVKQLWDNGSHFFELSINDDTVFGYEDGNIWIDDISPYGDLSNYDIENLSRKLQ